MSSNNIPQSQGHDRLPWPSTGHEPGTRLPGVRELLLPEPVVSSGHFSPSAQYHLGKRPPFSATTSWDTFSSPPKRISESSIRTLQSDQSDCTTWRCQSITTSSNDPIVAANHQTPTFMQPSPQNFLHISPLQEVLLSPRSNQYGSARTNRFEVWSSVGKYTNISTILRTIAGQSSESHDVGRDLQGPICANPWDDAGRHPDWGTTKAGKPRKRLAQACFNCRHKKIRCHPNSNSMKCAQCEKTHTDCRFESGCVVRKRGLTKRG